MTIRWTRMPRRGQEDQTRIWQFNSSTTVQVKTRRDRVKTTIFKNVFSSSELNYTRIDVWAGELCFEITIKILYIPSSPRSSTTVLVMKTWSIAPGIVRRDPEKNRSGAPRHICRTNCLNITPCVGHGSDWHELKTTIITLCGVTI